MTRLKALLFWFWDIAIHPSTHLSLAFLALGGFVCGIMFWGAFNTALELTNTEKFCTSCHEMRDNVYQELQRTVHFSNRSGVRATCPDCHVPHNWTDKIARKMQASQEVRGRGVLNRSLPGKSFSITGLSWPSMNGRECRTNNSLECRNCHSAIAMDFSRQTSRAATIHAKFLIPGQRTCIDCHSACPPIARHDRNRTGLAGTSRSARPREFNRIVAKLCDCDPTMSQSEVAIAG